MVKKAELLTILNGKYISVTEIKQKNELVSRLKKIHRELSQLDIDDENCIIKINQVDSCAAALVANNLINHKDKTVRLWTACCIVDVLKLYAPTVPYDGAELLPMFQLFISQLEGLEKKDDPNYKMKFYLLEKLAQMKAWILIIDEDEEILQDLFTLFFKTVSDEHSKGVVTHFMFIMISCIEDSDTIPQPLLLIILRNLISPYKKKKPEAFRLAQKLIQRTAGKLQPYVAQYLNDILTLGGDIEPETSGSTHELIFELNRISSDLVKYVLPSLEGELKYEDLETRAAVVQLLATMFAGKSSTLSTDHSDLFSTFLERFNDINSTIRLLMVEFSKHFIVNKEIFPGAIRAHLEHRIQDSDEKVRSETISALCEIIVAVPNEIKPQLMIEAAERMKDKKLAIRKQAIEGFAELYRKLKSNYQEDDWSKDLEDSFGFLPTTILHCYLLPDEEDKSRVEKVLDEELLPVDSNLEERTACLLELVTNLDELGEKALEKLFNSKKQIQTEFKSYIELRREKADITEIDRIISFLAQRVPGGLERGKKHFKELHEYKDGTLFKAFEKLCDPDTTLAVARKIHKEHQIKFKPKGSLNEFIKLLTKKLSMTIVTFENIPTVFEYLNDQIEEDDSVAPVPSALKFLKLVGRIYPNYLKDSSKEIVEILKLKDRPEIIDTTLNMLAFCAGELNIDAKLSNSLLKQLTDFVLTGTPYQSKYAVHSLHKLFDAKKSFKTVLEQLSKKLLKCGTKDFFKVSILSSLKALGWIAELSSEAFLPHAETIVNFILQDLLVQHTRSKSGSPFESQVLGIKLLSHYLVSLTNYREAAATEIIEKLFEILDCRGDFGSTSQSEAAELRKASYFALIKIMKYHHYENLMDLEQFSNLLQVAKDEKPEIRSLAQQKFFKGFKSIGNVGLPLRYFIAYVLYATDPNGKLTTTAKQYLSVAIRARRQLLKGPNIPKEELFKILPENSLPHLIHFLAHFIDFDQDKKKSYETTIKYLQFYLDQILHGSDNFTFLTQLVSFIKQCEDVVVDKQENSKNIHIVAELCLRLLTAKSNAKGWKDVGGSVPGIYLPPSLYKEPDEFLKDKNVLPANFTLPVNSKAARIIDSNPSSPTKSKKRVAINKENEKPQSGSKKKKTPVSSTKKKAKPTGIKKVVVSKKRKRITEDEDLESNKNRKISKKQSPSTKKNNNKKATESEKKRKSSSGKKSSPKSKRAKK